VDKRSHGKTITVKINGEKRPFKEENAKQKVKSTFIENELEHEFDGSLPNSPLTKQASYKESAASQELVDESFDWILPESAENEIDEYKYLTPKKDKNNSKKKRMSSTISSVRGKSSVFKSFSISIIFAILIGTSFGFIMLKLVGIDQTKQKVLETSIPVNEAKEPENKTVNKTEKITLQPFTAYVVQGGVYSTKEGATEISNQVISKGASGGMIEMDGKNFLILGVADSIERAKGLGNFYKEKGIGEIWAKSFPVPEKTIVKINPDEKNFLENSQSVYQMLSGITSDVIINASIPNEVKNTISQAETILGKVEDKKVKNTKIKDLKKELVSAMELVKDYQNSNDQKNLIKAQQHLLNYFSLYYSLK
jgi:stage II sporulation protein B